MEPEKSVKTFGSDLLSEETAVDSIVDKETNFGWKVQKKEFDSEFHNLSAKNFEVLCQDMEKMLNEFKVCNS